MERGFEQWEHPFVTSMPIVCDKTYSHISSKKKNRVNNSLRPWSEEISLVEE